MCYTHMHTQYIYTHTHTYIRASLVAQMVNNLPAMQESWVRSLGQEDPLEKRMATHASTLKNEARGINLPDFRLYYKDTDIKTVW